MVFHGHQSGPEVELCISSYPISSQLASIGLEILYKIPMICSSTYLPMKLILSLTALGRFVNNELIKLSNHSLGFLVVLISQNHNL